MRLMFVMMAVVMLAANPAMASGWLWKKNDQNALVGGAMVPQSDDKKVDWGSDTPTAIDTAMAKEAAARDRLDLGALLSRAAAEIKGSLARLAETEKRIAAKTARLAARATERAAKRAARTGRTMAKAPQKQSVAPQPVAVPAPVAPSPVIPAARVPTAPGVPKAPVQAWQNLQDQQGVGAPSTGAAIPAPGPKPIQPYIVVPRRPQQNTSVKP